MINTPSGNLNIRNPLLWIIGAILLIFSLVFLCGVFATIRQAPLDSALISAIKDYRTNDAISLLKKGANANATDDAEIIDDEGRTEGSLSALMLACHETGPNINRIPADLSLMRALLEHGADPNTEHKAHKITALDSQIIAGGKDVVKLLLDHGADPNRTFQSTPLELAISFHVNNRLEIARLLIAHGANVNSQEGLYGMTAIDYAAGDSKYDIRMLELLLSSGVAINSQDAGGTTPIAAAAAGDSVEGVRYLLAHGADVSITNHDHESPLGVAKVREDCPEKTQVIRMLHDASSKNGNHRK